MGMSGGGGGGGLQSEINVTPMVDIMLVLLIIFMVVTPFLQQGVTVAIPRDFPFGYALVDVTSEGYAYRFVQISDEELLRSGYTRAGRIHRRYALGSEEERAFVWTRGD